MSPRPSVEEIRREEILQAACAEIVERGYSGVRVVDIARRSGTSSATVHYYFKTKHNVLTEALAFAGDRSFEEHRTALASMTSMRDRLVHLVEWQIPVAEARDNWILWLEVWNEATRRSDVKDAQEAAYRSWVRTLQDVVQDGIRAGEFRDVDAAAFTTTLAALIDGLGLQVLAGRSITPMKMRDLVLEQLARELFPGESVLTGARPAGRAP